MFWKLFRKPKPITQEEARAESAALAAFVKPLWVRFAVSLPASDPVPLSKRIIDFSSKLRTPLTDRYPDYRDAPDEMFINLTYLAVLESSTHPVDIVENAMINIEAKEISIDLMNETKNIVEVLKYKWKEYLELLPFRSDVELSTIVESFLMVSNEIVLKNYPVMDLAPPEMVWEMVWVAIIESGTHSAEEVSAARAQLAATLQQKRP